MNPLDVPRLGTPSRAAFASLAVLYVGLAAWLAWSFESHLAWSNWDRILEHHRETLANRERDPYQFKFFVVTWAVELGHRATGLSLETLYRANRVLSLLALLLAHHAWVSRLFGWRAGATGNLFLVAATAILFHQGYHHPYEFWGLAGFCLLLRALAVGASLPALCGLGLLTGLVWEKHALLAAVWFALRRRERAPLARTLLGTAIFGLACLAVPVAIRVALGADRALVDVTPLDQQPWGRVAAQQAMFVAPFAFLLCVHWRRVPVLVRLLWIYVPALLVAYAASEFILYELRSFWSWVPVFSATTCAWLFGEEESEAAPG